MRQADVDAQVLRLFGPQLREQVRQRHYQRNRYNWRAVARPEQIPPGEPGAKDPRKGWHYFFVKAGRGFGKTRTGAEAVREQVRQLRRRNIALVAPTLNDGRKLMIEGPSGILACSPPAERPKWRAADRELHWPNGAVATLYTSEEPERVRGGNHDFAWCEEIGSWRNPIATWKMLRLAVRIKPPLGDLPQIIITGTPRPTELVRLIVNSPHAIVQEGSTYDNAANLADEFLDIIREEFEGTRLGEQEIHARVLGDTPGALWRLAAIEALRVRHAPPDMLRVVVAVDPAVADPEERRVAKLDPEHFVAETGIVAAGRARCLCTGRDEQHAFVLDDLSGYFAPEQWAQVAIGGYDLHHADRLIGEENNGGALVAANVRAQAGSRRIAYSGVHASRGKQTRAEPVAILYDRRMVHHVGVLPKLEDQMTTWNPLLSRKSPDRMDALVWALTELMLKPGTNVNGRAAFAPMVAPGRTG